MYNLDLCHFGNQCAPGIIIDDILNIRKKYLFMLGMYDFNKILNFLKDDKYEKIYDKIYLKIDGNDVVHKLYDFVFNHEFKIENSTFTNYDAVKKRFDEKIGNFRKMLSSENKTVFITVAKDVDELKINDMLKWLKDHKKDFHLIIITDKEYSNKKESEYHSIIKLEKSFDRWWVMEDKHKVVLYKEMYNKFIACLKSKKIKNNFPERYANTEYGKSHPV